jgi:proline dehydrogenase
MIGLARSDRLRAWAGRAPGARQAAARFVGGESAQAGVATARRLRDSYGIAASLFYLGEYVEDPELIERNVMEAISAVEFLGAEGLDVHVSVDPTAIGFLSSAELARHNAGRIARAVAAAATGGRTAVMLDMEDFSLVEPTLALHRHLVTAGLPAAITLQARLRRTAHDLEGVVRTPTSVRLVKGAFPRAAAEDRQGREAINAAYLELGRTMLTPHAREAGFYPVFATHDDALARQLIAIAQDNDWAPHEYEFEMLYGVRPAWQQELRARGISVRVYLPFGSDWWPYMMRRVGENPRNILLMGRALLDVRRTRRDDYAGAPLEVKDEDSAGAPQVN